MLRSSSGSGPESDSEPERLTTRSRGSSRRRGVSVTDMGVATVGAWLNASPIEFSSLRSNKKLL
jgi:hypothetical protein